MDSSDVIFYILDKCIGATRPDGSETRLLTACQGHWFGIS
jgi:hypothetical protein